MTAPVPPPRYNIAYIPVDDTYQQLLQACARTHFMNYFDEYILGPNALAHVTLCQFYAPDDAAAKAAFGAFDLPARMQMPAIDMRVREGTLVNAGTFIAEFTIEKLPGLMELQKQCFQHLESRALKPLTPYDRYSPHITLARVREKTGAGLSLADIAAHNPGTFRPALGPSSESGMLLSVFD